MHLSAGDLLRAERDSGSEHGEMINEIIKQGKIVPVEVTCNLIKKAMEAAGWEKHKYLIDGFPRNEDNNQGWKNVMSESTELSAVLWFDANEDEMTTRILERGKTSGRVDDNIETLRKRFTCFNEEQMPIIEQYKCEGKVIKINAMGS